MRTLTIEELEPDITMIIHIKFSNITAKLDQPEKVLHLLKQRAHFEMHKQCSNSFVHT